MVPATETAALQRAIAVDPANADLRYVLGRVQRSANDVVAAERSFRAALTLRPNYVDAWIGLGILLRNVDRLEDAETCLRRAVHCGPEDFRALLNLGNVLYLRGQVEEAVRWLRAALDRNPESAEAHNSLGRALSDLNERGRAARHFLAALSINPGYFEALEGLGMCFCRAGVYADAISALAKAISVRPDALRCRLLLASSYLSVGRLHNARAEFEKLLHDGLALPAAKGGLAAVLSSEGDYAGSRALFEESLAAQPDDAQVRWNYSLLLLRDGDFERGWRHYESRMQLDATDGVYERALALPRWNGEALAGKTLLITREQGLGDEIMFASTVGELMAETRHCVIECDQRLEALYRRSFPTATVFGVKMGPRWPKALESSLQSLPAADYWIPAGTLACLRRRSRRDFPDHRGYLTADETRVRHWTERLRKLGPGLKVGISWRGGTVTTNTGRRSCTLQQMNPILGCPGVDFVSLQYGDVSADLDSLAAVHGASIHPPIHHWADALGDYDETAALTSALDLVISVCTAVVHLGGALGRAVWVMAPFVAEWRYGRTGPSMIWYPSVRLFRQPQPDAWNEVIGSVANSLREIVRERRRIEA